MREPERKVVGLHEGSFCDTLHELKELFDKGEIDNAVIAFNCKKVEGGSVTTRNFMGDSNVCLGLLNRIRYYIEAFEEG